MFISQKQFDQEHEARLQAEARAAAAEAGRAASQSTLELVLQQKQEQMLEFMRAQGDLLDRYEPKPDRSIALDPEKLKDRSPEEILHTRCSTKSDMRMRDRLHAEAVRKRDLEKESERDQSQTLPPNEASHIDDMLKSVPESENN